MKIRTTIIQNIFRVLLGSIMLYIGIAHLSFRRIEFQAQVPTWLTTSEGMMDLIVLKTNKSIWIYRNCLWGSL